MKFKQLILLSLLLITFNNCKKDNTDVSQLKVMDKVLKSSEIRCSYLLYPPYFMKNPKNDSLSGIFYDIMEKIGENADLKITWAGEVGYENIFTDLDNNKYEVFAGGLWPNATRAKAGNFSIPVFYSIIKAWGRTDDNRFVNNLSAINNPNVKIATIDGAMEDIIANKDFPLATKESLPQLSPFTQNLQNITSKKADVTFAEPGIIYEFLARNPGTLKELAPDKPLRIFGNCLVIKKGEDELQEFLNIALQELLYSGEIDKILNRYETGPNFFPRIALPYKVEEKNKIPNYSNNKNK